MQTRSKNSKGLSLVETMVVLALLTSIGVALSGMMQFFYQKNAFLLEQTAALDNARRSVLDAIHSIREASYGNDGTYPISAAATSSLTFFSDLDNDNSVEKVRYYLSNGTLYRGVTDSAGTPPSYAGRPEATTTVAVYVRNATSSPIFTYYDDSGVPLSATSTNVAAVSAVTISIWIDLNPNRAPNTFNLSETVTLRNLRN
ncbi:MAG: Type IV pilus pilin [Parcubacteria bacterium C7867-008]|nr:MAG: Type IV pilus pilin [Parcubacteria bacterium C7867-008]